MIHVNLALVIALRDSCAPIECGIHITNMTGFMNDTRVHIK